MNFDKNIFVAFGVAALTTTGHRADAADACSSIESITCVPISSAPTLDANIDDWTDVEEFVTPLSGALSSTHYAIGDGHVKIKCTYDSEKIHFLFQIPGRYRFDTEDNKMCASISTMFKMGEEATLIDMGGCPLAPSGECESAPGGCDPYKVDLGGHWELKTTEMGEYYGTNEGTGNDLDANNDDEYAVSAVCRFDDDDALAANEWEGAWLHTSPTTIERAGTTDGDEGSYVFEMSRLLVTASDETDAQLEAGTAIDFGFAFWDPYESEESGWTDAGHYVTGCSQDWISLRLVDEDGNVAEDDAPEEVAATDEEKPVVAEPVSEPIVEPVVEPLVADNSGDEEVTDKEVADEEDTSGSETASAASFPGVLSGLATSVFAYALRGLLA